MPGTGHGVGHPLALPAPRSVQTSLFGDQLFGRLLNGTEEEKSLCAHTACSHLLPSMSCLCLRDSLRGASRLMSL